MKTKQEMEEERQRKQRERLLEIYNRLPFFIKFEICLRILWYVFFQSIKTLPHWWALRQFELDEKLKRHGLPYQARWHLEKWFNDDS